MKNTAVHGQAIVNPLFEFLHYINLLTKKICDSSINEFTNTDTLLVDMVSIEFSHSQRIPCVVTNRIHRNSSIELYITAEHYLGVGTEAQFVHVRNDHLMFNKIKICATLQL